MIEVDHWSFVPLAALGVLSLAILISVRFQMSGRGLSAIRTIDWIVIYPGFAAVLAGIWAFIEVPDDTASATLMPCGLMLEAAGLQLRALFARIQGGNWS